MKKPFILVLLTLLGLTGCSIPKESFDCPPGQGVGCHSISEVNEQVNERRLNPDKPSKKSVNTTLLREQAPQDFNESVALDSLEVQRVSEEHLRIWFAPFQDEQGHLHEASIIHAVLKPGFWQVH